MAGKDFDVDSNPTPDSTTLNKVVQGEFGSSYDWGPGADADTDLWLVKGWVESAAGGNTDIDATRDYLDRMCLFGLIMLVTADTYKPGGSDDDDWDGSNNLQDSSGTLVKLRNWYTGAGGDNYKTKAFATNFWLWVHATSGKLIIYNKGGSVQRLYMFLLFSGDHDER